MTDRCVFFSELLEYPDARQRSYVVVDPPGTGLACIDATLRRGPDWYFARRWFVTRGGPRELYRALDRLEARGFRFRVVAALRPRRGPPDPPTPELRLRARAFLDELSAEERHVHRELFPDEWDLLAAGYDWDPDHVYRDGEALRPDAYGRVLETAGGILYEWVHVADEFTWRRYPLERVRVAITPSGR